MRLRFLAFLLFFSIRVLAERAEPRTAAYVSWLYQDELNGYYNTFPFEVLSEGADSIAALKIRNKTERRRWIDDDKKWHNSLSEYSYNKGGMLTEEKYIDDDSLSGHYIYTFNERSLCTSVRCLYGPGVYSLDTFIYDQNSHLLEMRGYNCYGDRLETLKFTYTEKGLLETESGYDALSETKEYFIRYSYDQRGRKTYALFLQYYGISNGESNLTDTIGEYSFTWDEHGITGVKLRNKCKPRITGFFGRHNPYVKEYRAEYSYTYNGDGYVIRSEDFQTNLVETFTLDSLNRSLFATYTRGNNIDSVMFSYDKAFRLESVWYENGLDGEGNCDSRQKQVFRYSNEGFCTLDEWSEWSSGKFCVAERTSTKFNSKGQLLFYEMQSIDWETGQTAMTDKKVMTYNSSGLMTSRKSYWDAKLISSESFSYGFYS
jgi:hypothetical protein